MKPINVWLENFNKKYKKGLSELATYQKTTTIGKDIKYPEPGLTEKQQKKQFCKDNQNKDTRKQRRARDRKKNKI